MDDSRFDVKPKTVVDGRYIVAERVGKGTFSKIYRAKDKRSGRFVALKFAVGGGAAQACLKIEQRVLEQLQQSHHACRFHGDGSHEQHDYIAMELAGLPISELRRKRANKRFTLGTALRLGVQMAEAIRDVHAIGYVHRDIKASNFVAHLRSDGRLGRECRMIDFGLCKRYWRDDRDDIHRKERTNVEFRGTAVYSSVHILQLRDAGRRDDLWSLFYLLVELAKGDLPWRRRRESKDEVLQCKLEYHANGRLVAGLPEEMGLLFDYLDTMDFHTSPDYDYIVSLLREACRRLGISDSAPYDWEESGQGAVKDSRIDPYGPEAAQSAVAIEAAALASGRPVRLSWCRLVRTVGIKAMRDAGELPENWCNAMLDLGGQGEGSHSDITLAIRISTTRTRSGKAIFDVLAGNCESLPMIVRVAQSIGRDMEDSDLQELAGLLEASGGESTVRAWAAGCVNGAGDDDSADWGCIDEHAPKTHVNSDDIEPASPCDPVAEPDSSNTEWHGQVASEREREKPLEEPESNDAMVAQPAHVEGGGENTAGASVPGDESERLSKDTLPVSVDGTSDAPSEPPRAISRKLTRRFNKPPAPTAPSILPSPSPAQEKAPSPAPHEASASPALTDAVGAAAAPRSRILRLPISATTRTPAAAPPPALQVPRRFSRPTPAPSARSPAPNQAKSRGNTSKPANATPAKNEAAVPRWKQLVAERKAQGAATGVDVETTVDVSPDSSQKTHGKRGRSDAQGRGWEGKRRRKNGWGRSKK